MKETKIGHTWVMPQWRGNKAAIAALMKRDEDETRIGERRKTGLAIPQKNLLSLPKRGQKKTILK